jgi:cobalt-zinc-cadmium efflux system membrane fusion protein
MNRSKVSILLIVVATVLLSAWIITSQDRHDHAGGGHDHGHDAHEEETPRGPHGGRLLEKDGFQLEITIFESGVPPEFHIYPYLGGKPLVPADVSLSIKLYRTGDKTDHINFNPQQDYLKGDLVIYEPHSFEVEVLAKHDGKTYQWRYENFEGRTKIPAEMAKAMGIETEVVGPRSLIETRTFHGQVHTNPNNLSHVRSRYPGVVKTIQRQLGDVVRKGDVLATINSNVSLKPYPVKAPISGLVIRRDIQVGQITGDAPLFVIADLSSVWVELDIFSRDLEKVKQGQEVMIETLDGNHQRQAKIEWVSPLAVHASQSVRARVEVDNREGSLRPGQFVRGHVNTARHQAKLAVRRSAIQTFRDFQVVYAKFGETYEVRMLEPGKSSDEWVEVISGIEPGTRYVTENSYLVKADIEKSGASHDH